jgi:hypothetical protein
MADEAPVVESDDGERWVVVVDANVVKGLMQAQQSSSHDCSGDPEEAFVLLTDGGAEVWLDRGGQMLSEWQACTQREWFGLWYSEFVQSTNVRHATVQPHDRLLRELRTTFGFPKSRDVWVLRTALTAAADGDTELLTDDMDYFDPKKKSQPKERQRHLKGAQVGAVRRRLKSERVKVLSVHQFVLG